jgi:hypothetical protein
MIKILSSNKIVILKGEYQAVLSKVNKIILIFHNIILTMLRNKI